MRRKKGKDGDKEGAGTLLGWQNMWTDLLLSRG